MVILPSEYQEVKYLESTGAQYIDSGISLNDKDFAISCDFEQTQYFSSTEQALFSIWTSQYNYWNCFIYAKSIRVYTAAHHVISDAITTGERRKVTVERNSSSWKLNYKNQSIQWSYTPTSINPTTLKIFTRGDTPSQYSSNTHIKMYALIIKIEGNEEANFIPCYRKSDRKPGMYDLVTKTFFTNAGTGEFIVGADVVLYNAPALVLRRRLLTKEFAHIEAASGSIATFQTNMVGKLKECKIYFEPVQEGEGDPSSENVRPITGWTGCEVTRCGKNFYNINSPLRAANDPYNAQSHYTGKLTGGIYYFGGGYGDSSGANIPVYLRGGLQYAISIRDIVGADEYPGAFFTWNGRDLNTQTKLATIIGSVTYRPISPIPASLNYNFTMPNTAQFVVPGAVAIYTYGRHLIGSDKIQVELGSTATAYEPYQGITIPIDWTNEAGTVYGGYVDLVKGEVVAEWGYIANYNSENLPSNWISDRDVYVAGATPTIGAQVAYQLPTPIHYPIAPITLKPLRGTNNVFANTNGDAKVKFYTH